MDRPTDAARRRTLELPTKPEAGLAEWTSKIKELQRQVDEDEEVEHRRLEEEIAASRAARLRRSAGYGSRANSVDLSTSEDIKALKLQNSPGNGTDAPTSDQDKQQNQEAALRKLLGERNHTTSPTAASHPRHEPMSLAAFMGGRATGPRLTRHAPQQDAQDPTQFEQRTHITAPHPVFGRGGVAMPGMVHRSSPPMATSKSDRDLPAVSSGMVAERDRRTSTPSVAKAYLEKVDAHTSPNEKITPIQPPRQRTISTPSRPNSVARTYSSQPPSVAKLPEGQPTLSTSLSGAKFRATTPQARDTSLSTVHTPPPVSVTPLLKPPRPSSSAAPRTPPPETTTTPMSPTKPAITTPSLARPILPAPRHSLGPQLPASTNTSAAFLRAPPPKDPTPSISRLQGRGFVQSMVRATSELSTQSPSSPPPPERKEPIVKKQASVLDRWPAGHAGSSPSPPIIAPKPIVRSKTVQPTVSSPGVASPTPFTAHLTGRPIASLAPSSSSHVVKRPVSTSESPRKDEPALGSASTMISYIKPVKTGDRPRTVSPPPRTQAESPEVDELGMMRSRGADAGRASRELGAAGKPLSHPTKDRAKKPRKAKTTPGTSRTSASGNGHAASSVDRGLPDSPAKAGSLPQLTELKVTYASTPDAINFLQKPIALQSPPAQAERDDWSNPPSPVKPFVPRKPAPAVDVKSVSPSPPTSVSADAVPKAPPKAPPKLGISTSPTVPSKPSELKSPTTPLRHPRIPSTGNRATVMDVAQAFSELSPRDEPSTENVGYPVSRSPQSPSKDTEAEDEIPALANVKDMVASWGPRNPAPGRPQIEKRKSSYDRYSAVALPPLQEEKSPAPTPAGTLVRGAVSPALAQELQSAQATEVRAPAEEERPTVPSPLVTPVVELTVDPSIEPQNILGDFPSAATEDDALHFKIADEPLPPVDVDALLKAERPSYKPNPDINTISVDVLSVLGNTTSTVSRDPHIFYDTETLAIVHRAKSKSSGLVATTVWAWRGKQSKAGEREERKLQELARRYGTSLIDVRQYCEPLELISVLGGRLVTRQGSRAHWTAENTTMHLVRSSSGATYIDELELSIRNLCSGFSYCLSILDTLYVWHGCGSTDSERREAHTYAQSLARDPSSVVELVEGESDNDEMFWMILGEGDYAKADYWRWRPHALAIDPRLWSVDLQKGNEHIFPVPSLAVLPTIYDGVYVIDCIWEFFVLVGSQARNKRSDIKLAVHTAKIMSKKTASWRPFAPTVHVVILPSQIPTDLRLTFRDLDETQLNCGIIPDHMNILTDSEAQAQLSKTAWDKSALQDRTMLPLGIDSSDLD